MKLTLSLNFAAAIMLPLLASCVSTLPVPRQIADEIVGEEDRERVRPIIRLPLRHTNGLPMRDMRSYARRIRDDGQIYFIMSGQLRLGPETLFCHYQTEVDSAVPAHERDRLATLNQRLSNGVNDFVIDELYNQRRGDFVFRPDRRPDDGVICLASTNVVHIRSRALVGRTQNSVLIEATVSQGDAFYTFFLERNQTDPPLETILTQVYGAEGPLFDVLGDDITLLSMVVGYYARALSE
jgi:hypothetical protein